MDWILLMTHLRIIRTTQAIGTCKVYCEPQRIKESSPLGEPEATCLIYFLVRAKRNLEGSSKTNLEVITSWELGVGLFPGIIVINLVLFCLVLTFKD